MDCGVAGGERVVCAGAGVAGQPEESDVVIDELLELPCQRIAAGAPEKPAGAWFMRERVAIEAVQRGG